MNRIKQHIARTACAAITAVAAMGMHVDSMAAGLAGAGTLAGTWTATFSGFTGCGQTAMQAVIELDANGSGPATIKMHSSACDQVITGQTFTIQTLDPNTGAGTANLSCGVGCGWNLLIQVGAFKRVMNLVDVDPVNPGNYIAGVAVRQ